MSSQLLGNYWWYVDGILHREDGPAVIYNGEKQWCINGKLHNLNGPSIICVDGREYWHIDNKEWNYLDYIVYYIKAYCV